MKDDSRKKPSVFSAGALGLMSQKSLGDHLMPQRVAFPKVDCPSLEGLSVTLDVKDITEDALQKSLDNASRKLAHRNRRALGERVSSSDEVCVDSVGYAQGKLIPFSARENQWIDLGTLVESELAQKLDGQKVGDSVQIDLEVPNAMDLGLPVGTRGIYVIDIRSADEVEKLSSSSKEFIRRFKRGKTLSGVTQALLSDLQNDAANALRVECVQRVVRQLVDRVQIQVSDELIDDQIKALWQSAEAPLLASKNFSPEEQEEALNGWLGHAASRTDIAQRIKVTAVMNAIVTHEKIQATPEVVTRMLKEVAQANKVPRETVEEMDASHVAPQSLIHFTFLLALEQVMKKVEVKLNVKGNQSTQP